MCLFEVFFEDDDEDGSKFVQRSNKFFFLVLLKQLRVNFPLRNM